MSLQDFDLAVIGAGIQGAGIAQAAAAAGYRVVILEREAEVAQATSSRSSKLIHGGLRYLETAQLGLVRECLRERALLLRLAPRLVRLRPFHIPIYAQTRRSPALIRTGLAVYAMLGGLDRGTRFRRLPATDWEQLDGLDTADLRAVFRYYDAQTDDAALTRAVIASAQQLGAELMTRREVTAVRLGMARQELQVRCDGQEQALSARAVVNATGPWINRLLERVYPPVPSVAVDLIAGTHLIVEGTLARGCYYVEAPQDGRAVFVLPWQGQIMIGTTERPHRGDPDTVEPTAQETEYLLETYRRYFPSRSTRVVARFAGLRVLPAGAHSPFRRPRETRLASDRSDRPRLVSVCGGKLTAYRLTAERVVRHLSPSLPSKTPCADTRRLVLD